MNIDSLYAVKTFLQERKITIVLHSLLLVVENLEVLPIHSSIKRGKFDLFDSLVASGLKFKDDDIIVISSKFVSMSEEHSSGLARLRSVRRLEL